MVINQFMVCLLQIGSIVMIMIMMMLNNVMTKTLMTTTVVVVMVVVARMMVDLNRLQKVQIAKTMIPGEFAVAYCILLTTTWIWGHLMNWCAFLFLFFYLNSISPGWSHPSIQRGARSLTSLGYLLIYPPQIATVMKPISFSSKYSPVSHTKSLGESQEWNMVFQGNIRYRLKAF